METPDPIAYYHRKLHEVAAIALDNARLYESFQMAYEYLTSAFLRFRWSRWGTRGVGRQ